jgi:STIMATE family
VPIAGFKEEEELKNIEETSGIPSNVGPNKSFEIDYKIWLVQLVIWCLLVLTAKVILMVVSYFVSSALIFVAWLLTYPLHPVPTLELIVVMIIVPLVMSSLQVKKLKNLGRIPNFKKCFENS